MIHLFSEKKVLHDFTLKTIVQNKIFNYFSSTFKTHRDYINSKKQKQNEKYKLAYAHDQSKLKTLRVSMTDLVPNFFTSQLPMHEKQKIAVPDDKSFNHLQNSYIKLDIPISSDPTLLNSLKKLKSRQVRIGRIMEAMDSVAGMVAYRHCFGSLSQNNSFVLVTGCVDSVNLFEPIAIDHDIHLQGYCNYVGRTSLQIEINLFQNKILKSNALFMMICRNAENHSKSYPCPKLSFDKLSQQQLQKAQKRRQNALRNVERRKRQIKLSYLNSPPNQQDIAILHNLFLNRQKNRKQNDDASESRIAQTTVTNTILMHIQERNVHEKIFGGFIMRELLQTAWVAVNRHFQGKKFILQDVTNIYFVNPVQVGTQLRITAKIAYTNQQIAVAYAQARTYNTSTQQQKLCCHFHLFTRGQIIAKNVYPLSYENGMIYLAAKNAFKELFQQGGSSENVL